MLARGMETSARLTEAWDLLYSGRFRDSLLPFSQAAADYRWAAEALYGTGVAQLSLNQDVYAEAAVTLSARPRALAYVGSLDPEVMAPLPVHPATAALLAAFWVGLALLRAALPFLGSFITLLQVAAGAGAVLQVLGLALTAVR